jgi:hypothetical protein
MTARWHHESFYARANHLIADRRYEGEKRCTRKMIGAETLKFGQQDKVRTVGITTAPKLIRRLTDTFVGEQLSDGTNIHKSSFCV